ncbi:hypothetical protein [Lentisalinibacter orientalis]|uniref:hypothetical protein n=1 Tax=Lentisalinibacter orientalis TaxID=2992241 RepID=UPI003865ED06
MQFHFNNEVFRLKYGMTSDNPSSDIAYTCRPFANQHPAPDAIARVHRLHQTEKLLEVEYSLSRHFEQAKGMAPGDPTTLMPYGNHLFRTGRFDQSETSFQVALDLPPEPTKFHYNLDSLYFRYGGVQSAQDHAVRAYELGFPLPGLRRKLIEAGQWPSNADDE